MSREIKFRAWYKPDLELSYFMKFETVYSNDTVMFEWNEKITNCPFTYDVATLLADNDWIKEQYTGLNDNNGVEIYEGDIVKWGHLNNEEKTHRIAIVEMYPDIQFHLIKNDVVFKFGSFAYQDTENHLEIIGNIHENKELLK